MPFCPQCRSEYRPGFDRCADCGVELIAELPAPPAEGPPEDWTEVFKGDQTRADLLCAQLDEAGIETVTPDEYASSLGWYAPGGFNLIRVLVKASDLERAKEILQKPPP